MCLFCGCEKPAGSEIIIPSESDEGGGDNKEEDS